MTINTFGIKMIVSVLIWSGLFWIFNQIGWISITSDLPLYQVLLYACAVNIVVSILTILTLLLIRLIPCVGVIVIILSLPFISFGVIYAAGQITGLYTTTLVWWQMIVMGLTFSLVRLPDPDGQNEGINTSSDLTSLPTPSALERRLDNEAIHSSTGEVAVAENSTSSRWVGKATPNVIPTKNITVCRSCGSGVTRKQETCTHCGYTNFDYNPD